MSTEVTRYSRVEILMAPGSPDGVSIVVKADGAELVNVLCDSYVWLRDYGDTNMPPETREAYEQWRSWGHVEWPESPHPAPETVVVEPLSTVVDD